jgi:hypothetical protein
VWVLLQHNQESQGILHIQSMAASSGGLMAFSFAEAKEICLYTQETLAATARKHGVAITMAQQGERRKGKWRDHTSSETSSVHHRVLKTWAASA